MAKTICKHCNAINPAEAPTCHNCGERNALGPSDATACSPREPLRQAYSREEMRDASVKWMIEQFGIPKDMEDDERDRWHTRCGAVNSQVAEYDDGEYDDGEYGAQLAEDIAAESQERMAGINSPHNTKDMPPNGSASSDCSPGAHGRA